MLRRPLELIKPLPTCTKQTRTFKPSPIFNMPSSKGKPTDPELREEIKEGKRLTPPYQFGHASLTGPNTARQRSSKSPTNQAAVRVNGPLGR